MRTVALSLQTFLFIFILTGAGCEHVQTGELQPTGHNGSQAPVCTQYAPVKIDIMPLTEFVRPDGAESKIALYVSLLDSFGSQIKSPATFRFELYPHVRRSAEPKGTRTIIWPDVDLSDPATNSRYWRDFLRAYEFDLPFEPAENQDYILQVTCLTPVARRISAEYSLNYAR